MFIPNLEVDFSTDLDELTSLKTIKKNGKVRAVQFRFPGNNKLFYLSRYLYQKHVGEIPKGMLIDHADMNPLNNKISNLRLATHKQNSINSRKKAGCTSKYKGVYLTKSKKWAAQIRLNGNKTPLGTFNTEEAAALAYDTAAVPEFGEFAQLNLTSAK